MIGPLRGIGDKISFDEISRFILYHESQIIFILVKYNSFTNNLTMNSV